MISRVLLRCSALQIMHQHLNIKFEKNMNKRKDNKPIATSIRLCFLRQTHDPNKTTRTCNPFAINLFRIVTPWTVRESLRTPRTQNPRFPDLCLIRRRPPSDTPASSDGGLLHLAGGEGSGRLVADWRWPARLLGDLRLVGGRRKLGPTGEGAAASGSQRGPREVAGQWAVAIRSQLSAVVVTGSERHCDARPLRSPSYMSTASNDLMAGSEGEGGKAEAEGEQIEGTQH
jgi:hypothetical protein